jgi:hypothetical protein
MLRFSSTILLLAAIGCILKASIAFAPSFVTTRQSFSTSSTFLSAESPCSRREAFLGVTAAAFATVAATNPVEPAAAKYSDYSRREKDWQERQAKGDVKYSTARDLRRQLAEIVPENSEASKVFCPNGPSAAVSPLMENKCSDTRMALPSVYGRSNDVMGNSIPGFQGGYDWSNGGSTSITSAAGGFPGYYKK